MIRIVFGVVGGFAAWLIVWVAIEKIISAVWRDFGAHQAAFLAAIESGGPFTANPAILVIHIVLASIVSGFTGFLAAMIAGESKRAPLILGLLLLAMGLLKAAMSWAYVPVWYHIIFAGVLIEMTILGGKLKAAIK